MSDVEESEPKRPKTLSKKELDIIEKNRQKAKDLRQSKIVNNTAIIHLNNTKNIISVEGTKVIDSGGGFLLEPSRDDELKKKSIPLPASEQETIELPPTYRECIECNEQFACSYLWDNFGYAVCDSCRDIEDKHSLITKTVAKDEYLLKDCDIDKREPILKYILRPNPINVRWGEMKLYLHLQIEKRALEVWGSEEKLLEAREQKKEKSEKMKISKYNKQLKKLKMNVRSSLFDKTTATHVHKFGTEEEYNEEEDNYTHACIECGFVETYEKM